MGGIDTFIPYGKIKVIRKNYEKRQSNKSIYLRKTTSKN